MIKGLTLVRSVPSAKDFERLTSLFEALGFEPGKGWELDGGKGAPFRAPLGNIEFVTGREAKAPPLLVEVTQLDGVYEAVKAWAAANEAPAPTEIALQPWKSRLFTAEPVKGMTIGFWAWDDPVKGKPVAIEGDLIATGMKFAIVVARWNAVITDRLLQGSLDGLLRSGVSRGDIEIVRVPGCWEIPSAARTLAEQKRFDGIITLGLLLRGETAHYEAIYNEVARGIGQSQQETGIPHAFGVLTCETLEQALDRAGVKAGNKGFEAAIAAIEMASIRKKVGA
jgi:6,7-dimethyl-8-ribityllumazine synthase